IKMWETRSRKERLRIRTVSDTSPNTNDAIALSSDGTLIASASGQTVKVWRNTLSELPLPAIKSGVGEPFKPAASPARASRKVMENDFQWFGGLSYPDPRELPFVKVHTNSFTGSFQFELTFGEDESKQSGEVSSPVQQTLHGFLLEKNDNSF